MLGQLEDHAGHVGQPQLNRVVGAECQRGDLADQPHQCAGDKCQADHDHQQRVGPVVLRGPKVVTSDGGLAHQRSPPSRARLTGSLFGTRPGAASTARSGGGISARAASPCRHSNAAAAWA
jgi:hypothetical protein